MLGGLLASHRIGRVLGIEVRVSFLLYVLVGLFVLADLPRGIGIALSTLIVFGFLIVFVFLHEMGHSLAAFKEGVSVHAIYLHPLGGLARLAGQLPGPMAEMAVALAGPFVSLLLGAVFFLPVHLFGGALGGTFLGGILYHFFLINMVLAIFNLLPIFPMDGGRVLTAGLVMKFGVNRALILTGKVARFGLVCLGLVGVAFLVSGNAVQGIVLLILAVYLYTQGQQEILARQYVAGYTGGGGGAYEPWREAAWENTSSESGNPEPGWLRKSVDAWKAKRVARQSGERAEARKAVDEILRKVNEQGIGSLTPKERDLLNRASRDFRDGSG